MGNLGATEPVALRTTITCNRDVLGRCSGCGPNGFSQKLQGVLGADSECARAIRDMVQATIDHSKVPLAWKKARASPLLKCGKPARRVDSYRPIPITNALARVAERPVAASLSDYFWLHRRRVRV